MNSFKSACNFAKSTAVSLNQLQENVEPLLWCQVGGVELIVSHLGVFKTAEHLSDSFHRANVSTQRQITPFLPATATFDRGNDLRRHRAVRRFSGAPTTVSPPCSEDSRARRTGERVCCDMKDQELLVRDGARSRD